MGEYTPHQKKIIERYYDQRDEIMLTRLQEIVTDLYLAETEKKEGQLWKRAAAAMKALKIPTSLADHILDRHDVEILAHNVRQWLQQARRNPPRE